MARSKNTKAEQTPGKIAARVVKDELRWLRNRMPACAEIADKFELTLARSFPEHFGRPRSSLVAKAA